MTICFCLAFYIKSDLGEKTKQNISREKKAQYLLEGSGGGVLCPDITNKKIILNEAEEGKGEQLRAGKPRDEEDMTEDRHSVGREEFRGMNGLEKKYNLVVVGAGLSGSVVAERASKLLGLKVILIVL